LSFTGIGYSDKVRTWNMSISLDYPTNGIDWTGGVTSIGSVTNK